jgi:Ca2+-binding EF-hand superfamily protein
MKKSILTIAFLSLTLTTLVAQQNTDEKPRRKGPPTIKQLFKDLDTDEDGKISLKEVKGPLKKDFKKIDLNKDGFLSKEEIKKAPKPKRPEKPEMRENK